MQTRCLPTTKRINIYRFTYNNDNNNSNNINKNNNNHKNNNNNTALTGGETNQFFLTVVRDYINLSRLFSHSSRSPILCVCVCV